MTWPLVELPAYSHGGPFTAGNPIGVVVHSTESSNGPNSAEAVAGPGWFGGPKAGTSAHKIVDQNTICEGVNRNTVAWHVGPNGNGLYIGYEFCGMAGWSVAQWNAPENLAMIRGAAPHIADDLKAIGAPARWLSLTQVAQRQKGLLTHNDVRLALGGTTHSDPGPNFPYAFLLSEVSKYMGGTPAPAPHPAPTPAPGRVQIASYIVKAGDNLTLIASHFPEADVTADTIAADNHLANPNDIQVGQVLRILSAQAPKPAPAPAVDLPTMAYGEHSENVRKLQAFLNRYNWRPVLPLLPTTGYYGPSTAAVLHRAGQQLHVQGDSDGKNFGPHFQAAFAKIGFRV